MLFDKRGCQPDITVIICSLGLCHAVRGCTADIVPDIGVSVVLTRFVGDHSGTSVLDACSVWRVLFRRGGPKRVQSRMLQRRPLPCVLWAWFCGEERRM
jgi:hypothetical protein